MVHGRISSRIGKRPGPATGWQQKPVKSGGKVLPATTGDQARRGGWAGSTRARNVRLGPNYSIEGDGLRHGLVAQRFGVVTFGGSAPACVV
jgi:hypothetical protein